ncbi:MAG: hypothetical protein ACTHK1_09710 [Actinomycetales bacterium]
MGQPAVSRRGPLLPVLLGVACVAAVVLVATRLGVGPVAAVSAHRAGAPPAGQEEHATRLLPAPAALADARYSFMHVEPDDTTPVTWSPCRPVHYVVRPDHAPPDGPQLVAESFQRLSAATGLRFVDDGATEEPPTPLRDRRLYQPDRYGDRWAPVLVAWATPQEVPDFGVDIAGEAGPAAVYAEDRTLVYVSGTVYLDPVKIGRLAQEQGEPVARAIVLHELGHLAGLGHANDEWQVMWRRGNAHQFTEYQSGDLSGLARLGTGRCHPDV